MIQKKAEEITIAELAAAVMALVPDGFDLYDAINNTSNDEAVDIIDAVVKIDDSFRRVCSSIFDLAKAKEVAAC